MKTLILLSLCVSAFAAVLDGTLNVDDSFEPMVAFSCGRQAMYLTPQKKWKSHPSSGCAGDFQAIRSACMAAYPSMNITNVMPASREVTIPAWAPLDDELNAISVSVRPYRCLVNSFDSDALLVPDNCRFSHVNHRSDAVESSASECASYDEWNITANENCNVGDWKLYSFSVFMPCVGNSGLFSGVEFVCCPSNVEASAELTPSVLTISTQDDTNAVSDANSAVSASDEQHADFEVSPDDKSNTAEQYDDLDDVYDDVTGYDQSKNYYQIYMNFPEQLGLKEIDSYRKAVAFVKRFYETQVDMLDLQYNDLMDRVTVLRSMNVSTAEQLFNSGSAMLRNLTKSTLDTWKRVRDAMDSEHQKRVEMRLENDRLDRVEAFMNTLDEAAEYDDLEAIPDLLHALKQYVRSEEKERIHWINRYEHLLDKDPVAAEQIKLTVKEMLIQIEERLIAINESLKRVPRIAATVRTLLNEFLISYADVDQEVSFLFPELDFAPSLQQLLRPDESSQQTDFSDVDATPSWLVARADWIESDAAPSNRNRIWIIVSCSVAAAVTLVVVGAIVFVCCLRAHKCNAVSRLTNRKRRTLAGRSANIFLVHTAAQAEKYCPLNDVFAPSAAGSRTIVRSPTEDALLRKMQMRGFENPISNDGRLALDDDEASALVEPNLSQSASQQTLA